MIVDLFGVETDKVYLVDFLFDQVEVNFVV